MMTTQSVPRNPAVWLPPLYFAEGLPAAIITEVSLLMFQFFGMDSSGVAFWTNFLGLFPLLAVKLLCAPVVDAVSLRRKWIISMEFTLAVLFLISGAVCKTVPAPVPLLIAVFFLAALMSGVHDIAADGFYILALSEHDQAVYSGLRSVFYRIATVVGSGGFVILAGVLSDSGTCSGVTAWSLTLVAAGVLTAALAVYSTTFLPHPVADRKKSCDLRQFLVDFGRVFVTFFRKEHVGVALLFLLLYRLGEAQLGVMSKLFLIGPDAVALTKTQYGFLVGVIGVIMMLIGGVLAGFLCAKFGLRKMLLPMVLAINVPDALYLLMAFMSHVGLVTAGCSVAVEQFGYGFGFTGYMLFMVWFASTSPDDCKTSHFALMTLFMIAGIRLPGMPSGWIADHIAEWIPIGWTRYQLFFLWVLVCTIPGFYVTALIRRIVAEDYGKKR